MIKLAPSLLSADFSNLAGEVAKLEQGGADFIHIDVMDGHFVPNITIGPGVLECLKFKTSLPFDVHLMIENPDAYIQDFADAGASIISVHAETCYHIHRTLHKIRNCNVKAGIALNPSTPLEAIEWILPDTNMVIIMAVNPGFGNQIYIPAMTHKIRKLRELIDAKGLNVDIEVDGGITLDNVKTIAEAGADIIVSGSTIFKSENISNIIARLKNFSS